MEPEVILKSMQKFFFENKGKYESLSKERIIIDFKDIILHDFKVAEAILDNAEEGLKAVQQIAQAELGVDKIIIHNINNLVPLESLRKPHFGKLIEIEGIIKHRSGIKPRRKVVKLACNQCGAIRYSYQEHSHVKYPTICVCGSRKNFKVVDELFVDQISMQIEQIPSGDSPTLDKIDVRLEDPLTAAEFMNSYSPGERVKVTGILKREPKFIRGKPSNIFHRYFNAVNLQRLDERPDDGITQEDIKQIKEIAEWSIPTKIELIAPAIVGHDIIKEALLLQLVGGVYKERELAVKREFINILLVGDPSCIVGESLITLSDGTFKRIKKFGSYNSQQINEKLRLDLRHNETCHNGQATDFHKHPGQKTKRIILESTKEITCTYDHPLYSSNGWKQANELKEGNKIRVLKNIISNKRTYEKFKMPTAMPQAKNIKLPVCNENVATIMGYAVGDGSIHRTKGIPYSLDLFVNEEEEDLISLFKELIEKEFGILPSLTIRQNSGFGRKNLVSTFMNVLSTNSILVTKLFDMKIQPNRIVPDIILRSKDTVLASFLAGLFEADGCVFIGKMEVTRKRARARIALKSSSHQLLLDVQTLLIRFGIQARVYSEGKAYHLNISKSEDIVAYSKKIGFLSIKKKAKLIEAVACSIKASKTQQKRLYERVVKIEEGPQTTVYDLTVKDKHRFIANGIVSHNTGKSVIGRSIIPLKSRARYVGGSKGATGVGLTAGLVRDEDGNFALACGAVVLANGSILVIDEFEKMNPDAVEPLHEAMSVGTITINKGGINATMNARTAILAIANPKFGRWDNFKPLIDQVELQPSLLSRFDFIFAVKDISNEQEDTKVARGILSIAEQHEKVDLKDYQMFRKFLAYSSKITPTLSKEAADLIESFFVSTRKKARDVESSKVPLGFRQLDSLIRLTEAYAKLRLCKTATKEDAVAAIGLITKCLAELGVDLGSGVAEIDKIEMGKTGTRQKADYILDQIPQGTITEYDDVIKACRLRGLEKREVEILIEKMKKEGDLFEPQAGWLKRL